MKKQFLILAMGLFMTIGLTAQNNKGKGLDNRVKQYIERVETKIELTEDEKTKLFELKKEHLTNFNTATREFKGTPDLRKERQKVGKAYKAKLAEAFGADRAKEIADAGVVKKN